MDQQKIAPAAQMPHVDSERIVISPLEDNISSVELIRASGSDLDIVNAARVSYGKMSNELTERDQKLINFLMMHNHTSPFEHNQLSFRVKAPIFVVRQWFRHRMHSYNEISYRYVKSSLEFYTPPHWRYQHQQNHQASYGEFHNELLDQAYKKAIDTAVEEYEKLLEAGVCREQARCVLPLCTYTEFIHTCNLHSFMNFLKLRIKPDAQHEIRVYAQAMLKLAQPHFPAALKAFMKKHDLEGLCD